MVCTITKNEQITDVIYDMEIQDESLAKMSKPGQFVHIKCGDALLLRRPISVCDKTETGVRILYQVKGEGTKWMAQQKKKGSLDVLGPLGKGFELKDNSKKAVFVGGGIGTFPLLMPVKHFGENASVLLGFANKQSLALVSDFEAVAGLVQIATDDGSFGRKGFVTELLKEHILKNHVDIIYACGPEGMLKAVAQIAHTHEIPCQISTEARMSCGVGACLGCAIKVRLEDGTETYQHVCKDGPVFDSRDVVFE